MDSKKSTDTKEMDSIAAEPTALKDSEVGSVVGGAQTGGGASNAGGGSGHGGSNADVLKD